MIINPKTFENWLKKSFRTNLVEILKLLTLMLSEGTRKNTQIDSVKSCFYLIHEKSLNKLFTMIIVPMIIPTLAALFKISKPDSEEINSSFKVY